MKKNITAVSPDLSQTISKIWEIIPSSKDEAEKGGQRLGWVAGKREKILWGGKKDKWTKNLELVSAGALSGKPHGSWEMYGDLGDWCPVQASLLEFMNLVRRGLSQSVLGRLSHCIHRWSWFIPSDEGVFGTGRWFWYKICFLFE